MTKKGIIILGSSRSNGNTRKIVDAINKDFHFEVINLLDKNISYYDYEHKNQEDDFYDIAKKIIATDVVIFATPMYWYSMSAPLKTFFDRLSDLVRIRKQMGRGLKNKHIMVVSCGSEALDFDFYIPFRKSANYLDMIYSGDMHAWMEKDGVIPLPVKKEMLLFTKKLHALLHAN